MPKSVRTLADLEKLLAAEGQAVARLRQKRQALEAQLDELAGVISRFRGGREKTAAAAPVRPRRVVRRKRRRGGKTLRAAIAEVLGGSSKPMRARDIAQKMGAAGFKTSSKNLNNMISATLAQTGDFKRVGKGLYALKK
jgi:hypothetical protein